MEGRKKFKIPDQIDKGFYFIRSLKFSHLLVLVPLGGLGYFIYQLFPDGDGFYQQFRMIISFLPLTLGIAGTFMRPIKFRKNVNLFQFIIWVIRFRQRQKVFYFRKKKWMER
ncbi:hypothetical protein SAMN04487866_12246 [Thermoactinomyces sp. DSM 45891]|nr:hypothetical protein SAMN04487866_12246 [Thermoactinomyces sp. DSM 45891]